eukprot:gene3715-9252_t
MFAEASAKTGAGVDAAFRAVATARALAAALIVPRPFLRFGGAELRDHAEELRDAGIGAQAAVELQLPAPAAAAAAAAGRIHKTMRRRHK